MNCIIHWPCTNESKHTMGLHINCIVHYWYPRAPKNNQPRPRHQQRDGGDLLHTSHKRWRREWTVYTWSMRRMIDLNETQVETLKKANSAGENTNLKEVIPNNTVTVRNSWKKRLFVEHNFFKALKIETGFEAGWEANSKILTVS